MNKFNLNEELVLDIKNNKNSEVPLEKRITKIILAKYFRLNLAIKKFILKLSIG